MKSKGRLVSCVDMMIVVEGVGVRGVCASTRVNQGSRPLEIDLALYLCSPSKEQPWTHTRKGCTRSHVDQRMPVIGGQSSSVTDAALARRHFQASVCRVGAPPVREHAGTAMERAGSPVDSVARGLESKGLGLATSCLEKQKDNLSIMAFGSRPRPMSNRAHR